MTGWLVQCRRPLAEGIDRVMKMCTPEEHRAGIDVRGAFVLGDCPEETLVAVAEWWVSWRGTVVDGVPVPGLTAVAP